MTRTTTTRRAHDVKGGDTVRINGGWFRVADAFPNTAGTYVIAYWVGLDVRRHLVPVDDDLVNRSADIYPNQGGYSVVIWNQLRQGPALAHRWFTTLERAEAFARRWNAETRPSERKQ
jgi:hypothetical protein